MRDRSDRYIYQVKTSSGWKDTPFADLKVGDVFRFVEKTTRELPPHYPAEHKVIKAPFRCKTIRRQFIDGRGHAMIKVETIECAPNDPDADEHQPTRLEAAQPERIKS